QDPAAPRAAAMLGAEQVRWDLDGWVADNGRRVSLADLAAEMVTPGDPSAHVQVTLGQERSPDRGYCAQAAEVEVDVETGAVEVRRLITVQDVGAIINPLGHQGQIDGGAMQGFGFAMIEEMLLEDGRVTTNHLGAYKLPTSADIPPLETVHLSSE